MQFFQIYKNVKQEVYASSDSRSSICCPLLPELLLETSRTTGINYHTVRLAPATYLLIIIITCTVR
jgi:hypothetical protein